MGRGRTEPLWAIAKAHCDNVRAALGAKPLPHAAMNPYWRETRIAPAVKLRIYCEGLRARYARN